MPIFLAPVHREYVKRLVGDPLVEGRIPTIEMDTEQGALRENDSCWTDE